MEGAARAALGAESAARVALGAGGRYGGGGGPWARGTPAAGTGAAPGSGRSYGRGVDAPPRPLQRRGAVPRQLEQRLAAARRR